MNLRNYNFVLLLLITVFSSFSVNAQYISTFAGNGAGAGYSGDGGQAKDAQLNSCTGVVIDGAGNMYIADKGNNVVRRVNTAGVISTFAGTNVPGYSGDGGNANMATLNMPEFLATDAGGNIYISDVGNNVIRMVSPSGIISTYAGNGTSGYTGDADTAKYANFNAPQGIALDASGNLYIADAGNHAIRMVANGTRIVSTVAGNGSAGYSGNGGAATIAMLNNPSDVAIDASGNLYIADLFNNVIRKVDAATGTISTIVGNGMEGNSGDGGQATAATMKYPTSVAIDNGGNMYIADQGNYNIRVVNTSGLISRVAGTSTNGYSGDGGMATAAKLAAPTCIYPDGWGRVYIADNSNNVIRVISSTPSSVGSLTSSSINIFPNPSNGHITITGLPDDEIATFTVTDMLGRIALVQSVAPSGKNKTVYLNNLPTGNYLLKVVSSSINFTEKLVIE